MGLGVLESKTSGQVPGTVLLDQEAAHSEFLTSALKHGRGKDGQILLAPQPSEDPNDPLNWSFLEKHFVGAIIYLGIIVHSAATAPLLSAGTVEIAEELRIPIASMVKLSGYYILAAGAVGPLVGSVARKYGKRPVFVFSSIFAVIGCIVGETAQGYSALLAARLIQGMAQTAYETLVFAAVGDMFFLHERGPRVALGVFLLNAIANCVSIIAGTITTNLGWRFNFHILVPFAALQAILVLLFVPETTYRRQAIYNTDTAGSEADLEKLALAELQAQKAQLPESVEVERVGAELRFELPARKTLFQRMALYNGTFVADPVWKILLSYPVILLNLGGAFVVFSSGILLSWYATTLILNSIILPGPPYLYTSSQVGYASVGPLIGALFAGIFMGASSDHFIRFMTRRNRGVYEPEFQLPLTLVGAVCSIAGMIGLGYTLAQGRSIYLVCFVWGVTSFGLSVCNTTYFNYALSSFREYSSEIFIMSALFRNFFGYGISNFIVPWLQQEGAINVFDTLGGILAAVFLLTIPFYVIGKKYRQFWHYHNLFKLLHLETDKTGAAEG